MLKIFDSECEECGYVWEEEKSSYHDPAGECPSCGSNFTHPIMGTFKVPTAKNPYSYLDGRIPDPRPIKSYANDRRKKRSS